jgi:small-conductance mechanosensitive channel
MAFEETLAKSFFGNTVEQYLLALAVFVVVNVAVFVFKKYVLHVLHGIAKKTAIEYDDMLIDVVKSIHYPFYLILALYISLWFLAVPQLVMDAGYYLLLIGILFYAVRALQATIDFFATEYDKRSQRKSRLGGKSKAVEYLSRLGKWLLWLFAGLILVGNMGIEITPLLAGLGIGGLAIAFALQTILSDVFNFFAIYMDKPFMEGEFLKIGDDMGTVEKIGLRSTRIKTLRGEELVVSNNELTSTRIHNFGKMQERRVSFTLGATYETPTKKLEKVPGIVQKVIEAQKDTRFDRVHFKSFGDFSLNFEVVYFMETTDYLHYMDVQQAINLGIKRAFEKEGIEFAYPTQKVFVSK